MFDSEILEQLKTVFAPLESEISLRFVSSPDPKQGELEEMLRGMARTSKKITAVASGEKGEIPGFRVFRNGQPTGVVFQGIPGGHEFSSLVLAILNADGKGRLPEGPVLERIRRIRGPVRLRTVISLTCENCPDVVQALNQMALVHPDFEHAMVDGAFIQTEVSKLGIQGVPSVLNGKKLLHSGRGDLLDLLGKVEGEFGKSESAEPVAARDLGFFDVVVLGGGPAGVAAAIYSARKGLKTAVLAEKVGGQVQETKGIENLISVTYTEGPALSAQLREHMKAYPISLFEQRRVTALQTGAGEHRRIDLEGGEFVTAATVIVATGAKWRELGIPGEKEYLGRGVAFCPHCDGPFYKGKRVAVIGGGNSGVEAAIDLAGIVKEVVLFEYQDELKADRILVDKLKSLANTSIVTGARTAQIQGDGQKVVALEYEERSSKKMLKVDLDGVFVQIGLLPNSRFLKGVIELSPMGEVVVDAKGRTSQPGIYAAGDVTTTPYKQIVIAMGEGARTALAAFEDRMLRPAAG